MEVRFEYEGRSLSSGWEVKLTNVTYIIKKETDV
jgi:hypothetical protein